MAARSGSAAEAGGAVPTAIARLRAKGERITPARRVVLEVLAESAEHLSAEDVVSRAETRQPGLHRATIYRTLESLCGSGVAVHVHLGHGATTYHLVTGESRPHIHISCVVCGDVLDTESDLLDGPRARLLDELGFRLDPAHTALLGTCARCAAASHHHEHQPEHRHTSAQAH